MSHTGAAEYRQDPWTSPGGGRKPGGHCHTLAVLESSAVTREDAQQRSEELGTATDTIQEEIEGVVAVKRQRSPHVPQDAPGANVSVLSAPVGGNEEEESRGDVGDQE